MRADFTTGALVASLAAGPMLIGPIIVVGILSDPRADGSQWAYLPLVIFLSALFGFAISLIPNFVGAAAVAAVGTRHPGLRHPVVWAASGFAFGWLIAGTFWRELSAVNAVIGTDGLLCALICRHFTTWPD